MKAAENQKQPIAVTHLERELNVTNELDQELQHFLISRTKGEALEIVPRAEREPGLEQRRRLAAFYDPFAAGRSLDDSMQIFSPPKAAQIDDFSRNIQAWENLNNATENALETSCLKTCDWLFLLSMCPIGLEKELTARQHLFPDYAQMKARIATVINSRTRGVAPMMTGNLSDEGRQQPSCQ